MNRKTFMLAVVGDSAAGKTTLTGGIVDALGRQNVTAICSDDYHRYNRKQRAENGISALEPAGNYLDIMEQHFRLMREGQPILKPIYNHHTGDFDPPEYIAPTRFMIVEGLLGLHTRRMRLNFDVKVYLDPPEELRRAWKIKRDTTKRGYTAEQVIASLEKRKDISPAYIHPQKAYADMIVTFYPPAEPRPNGDRTLNARLILRPTMVHPDLTELIARSAGGPNESPAIHVELGRWEGQPVDFVEIDGAVSQQKARELEDFINNHMLTQYDVNVDALGAYMDGNEPRKSYPLALTQLLITYHLVMAEQHAMREIERG